ncbi:MAG: T9SS type A sorting domain-containing protein [Saprospirales bacterium]|nr:T9SS type A sorting domain-containing protein [Saprospirales bacterium]
MRTSIVLLIWLVSLQLPQAQTFWTEADPQSLAFPESARMDIYPQQYRTLELDMPALQQALAGAPLEFSTGARKAAVLVELPFPDGRMEPFLVVESPVMKPGLAAKFPMIKTFSAVSAAGKPYSARFDYTVQGFHAIIRTDEGIIYIDPFAGGQTQYYISYYLKDFDLESLGLPPMGCGWSAETAEEYLLPEEKPAQGRGLDILDETPVELRVYDMALACTGEYGQAKGGTVAAVMSSFNTAINRVNEIMTPEAAIKFELIENNDLLVFLNPATDPYISSNVGNELLDQNPSVINSIINVNFYDVGHVFTNGCVDVGGVAGGTVCSQNKAKGVTCHYSSSINHIAEQVMAHELAHQFSAGHSWSNCPDNQGQLASDSAYEPGSGSTIMSYAGACDDQDIQNGSDIYYHVGSLAQMRNYTTVSLGSTCPTIVATDNHFPEVDWLYENGFFIPISTPFELNAPATDPDGDALTYCWEQYDLGPLADMGSPVEDSPLFRSLPPASPSNRIFPRLQAILGGLSEEVEVLPTYSRNMTFRQTVRDNYPEGGGTIWNEVKFKATGLAGPFLVTHPNSNGIQFPGGSFQTITWDVANTDQAPVHCQSVNIRLSINGGQTFPYTLLAATPNTGSATVSIPNITAPSARIRVEAADNIFFDLSNFNFQIVPPTVPGFTFLVNAPLSQTVCIPGEVEIDFSSGSVLGYDSLLTLDIPGNLPSGVVAAFTDDQILPGESTTLHIDFSQLSSSQEVGIIVRVIAAGGDTLFFPMEFDLIYSDLSALAMATPGNGVSGLDINQIIFSWTDLPHVDTYDFQLATSPSFSEEDMVHEISGLTTNSYVSPVVLEKNELYFWRIRAANECAQSEFLSPFAFHSISLSCETYTSNDVPVGIPSTGTPTRTSEITILQEGTINDLNVINLVGYHEGIQQLDVFLKGPDGSQAKLFGSYCGSSSPFNLDLDDESPFNLPCPPNTGQAYKPAEPLGIFDGKNTTGDWTLILQVNDDYGAGGLLESWALEFCASFTPKNPYLSNNELLLVQPAGTRLIENVSLLVQDDDNTAEELVFTVVTPPQHGTLVWDSNNLAAGGTFRQISINSGNVWYLHSGDGSLTDSFSFVVEDGTGGWLGITTFNIEMDPNAPIATEELPAVKPLRIFPNPSSGLVRVDMPDVLSGNAQVRVINAQGGTLVLEQREPIAGGFDIDLSGYAAGMYWIQVQTERGRYGGKVVKK